MTRASRTRGGLAFAGYLLIAAVYTHPLLARRADAIASDRYDPVLNASILWWNATTVPFSTAWWTPPHYYPSRGIAAFTENLTGLGVISTPLFHATGDPLLTYNLTTFLTWPLSALAVFLLATSIGVRAGPAFAGGLAFGFAPYRIAQMAHLQVLACFWLPLALAALHAYLKDPRARWLVAFGAAWLLQSLTNGYFMLFGGVVVAMWLLYFCSTRETARLAPRIVAAWAAASLPLLPVLLEYRRVHQAYGLQRPLGAIIEYSAQAGAWLQAPDLLWWWGGVLRDGGGEANLFPGLTAVTSVIAAIAADLVRRRGTHQAAPSMGRSLRLGAAALGTAATMLVLYTVAAGPWRASIAGLTIRVSSIDRALLLAGACWLAVAALRPAAGRAGGRQALAFYAGATVAIMALCLGPEIRVGTRTVLDHAPYGWLLALPGFSGLRVPTRFWMLGAMCLATAAAVALDRLAPAAARWRAVLVTLASAGILADGWIGEMPTGRAPEHWTRVERRDSPNPLLELPIGPEFDAAATYRAVRHRRRVVNGVSGYDPPHYEWLQRGLNARDPEALLGLTSFGPLDVVVDGSADADGTIAGYVAAMPGAERVTSDGVRTLYRLPGSSAVPGAAGAPLTGVSAVASRSPTDLSAALDGDTRTAWTLAPQLAGDWIRADLGAVARVAAIGYAYGPDIGGYPRSLAVELSVDGATWQPVWEGRGFRHALAALVRAPEDLHWQVAFDARDARYVRLRLTETAEVPWTIGELRVLRPPSGR